MEPVGDLPNTQARALRVLGRIATLASDALTATGLPELTRSALQELHARAGQEAAVVSAEHYRVVEPLYVALHDLDRSLAGLGDDERVGAVRAELAELRLRVLDDIEQPVAPRHGTPSVGFEWQTNIKVVMKGEVPPSKTLLKRWPEDGKGPETLRLELDGHELEFVTSPATTREALDAQVAAIAKEVKALRAAGDEGHDYFLPEVARSDETGDEVHPIGYRVHVRHYEGTASGTLQATTARTLGQVKDLLLTYGGRTARSAIGVIDGFYQDAPPSARVAGLLYLVRYYAESLDGGHRDAQGPKVLLPIMCRTSFHSAYLLLDEEESAEFRRCVFHGQEPVGDLEFLTTRLAAPLGYVGPAGAEYEGPTLGRWYDSIVDGTPSSLDREPVDRDHDGEGPRGRHRDLLSPPRGYPAHRRGRHFTYAMGFFGAAEDGSLLFELRQVEQVPAKKDPESRNYSTNTVFDAMTTFADAEFALAATTTTTTTADDSGSERPAKRRRVEEKEKDPSEKETENSG